MYCPYCDRWVSYEMDAIGRYQCLTCGHVTPSWKYQDIASRITLKTALICFAIMVALFVLAGLIVRMEL